MAKGFNIRAWLGLDTKDYEKGISKAKRQTQQFSKGMKQSVRGATSASTGFLDRMTGGAISGFRGMFSGIKTATRGMNGFKKAIISTGIGALVVALGSLVTYLSSSAEGQRKLNKLMGGFKGIIGFVQNILEKLGKAMVAAFQNPKKAVSDLWNIIKQNLINRPKGIIDFWKSSGTFLISVFKLIAAKVKILLADVPIIGKAIDKEKVKKDADAAFEAIKQSAIDSGVALIQISTGLDKEQQKKTIENLKGFGKKAGEAWSTGVKEAVAKDAFEDARRALLVAQKKLDTEIKTLVRKSREEEKYSEAERLAFIEEAKKKNAEMYALKIKQQKEELRLQRAQMAMSPTNLADLDKEAELEAQIEGTLGEQERALRQLINRQVELQHKVDATAKSTKEISLPEGSIAAAEETLKKLRDAFNIATTDEAREALKTQISEQMELIDGLNGSIEKVGETSQTAAKTMEESLSESAKIVAEAFGFADGSFGAFAANLFEAIPKIAGQLQSLGVMELAMTRKKVAAKQGEAIASVTAEGAKAPWFMSIPIIAGLIATVVGVFSSIPKFATGGIVGGNSFSGDNILARVNSGEMILNKSQQAAMFGGQQGGEVVFEIGENKLVGILNRHNRKQQTFR